MIYRNTQASCEHYTALPLPEVDTSPPQAAGAGYDYPHLSYHLKAGNLRNWSVPRR